VTLGGGGVQRNVTKSFFAFRNVVFNALGRKNFVTGQDNASKDTFFLIYLIIQRNLGLKIAY
jgi:hypothetical protein